MGYFTPESGEIIGKLNRTCRDYCDAYSSISFVISILPPRLSVVLTAMAASTTMLAKKSDSLPMIFDDMEVFAAKGEDIP